MNKAFTLIELLVVVAIMGLLGTASVGGYRQMQRGMEERGVVQNVNSFIDNACRRAEIDRQPTAVYFWNEIVRGETEDENAVIIGKAVAVRRNGRITAIGTSKSGQELLIDEFGDLNLAFPGERKSDSETDPDDKDDAEMEVSQNATKMRLYKVTNMKNGMRYTLVYDKAASTAAKPEVYLTRNAIKVDQADKLKEAEGGRGNMVFYGFAKADGGNESDWKVGDAYGMEFANIELPHGYVFDGNVPTSLDDPVRILNKAIVFDAKGNSIGDGSVQVMSMRPNASGQLAAQRVGTTRTPQRGL